MKYIGIDGCKSGWFCVVIDNHGWDIIIIETIDDFHTVVDKNSIILIDIPIGLREKGSKGRLCDLEARKHLRSPRCSSVFSTPVRQALIVSNYEEANQINFSITGKKLSRQAFNIMPKIKEVDDFMCTKNSDGIM